MTSGSATSEDRPSSLRSRRTSSGASGRSCSRSRATATVSFPEGVLDVERFADGRINLFETLEPILRDKPERELIIKINRGGLTFRAQGLPEPVVADIDVLLDIAADPGPVTWSVALAHRERPETGRLDVKGSHTRPADEATGGGDTTVNVKASRWPWTLAIAGVSVGGELDATVDANLKSGQLASTGAVTIRDLAAGDSMRLEHGPARLGGRWRQRPVDGASLRAVGSAGLDRLQERQPGRDDGRQMARREPRPDPRCELRAAVGPARHRRIHRVRRPTAGLVARAPSTV